MKNAWISVAPLVAAVLLLASAHPWPPNSIAFEATALAADRFDRSATLARESRSPVLGAVSSGASGQLAGSRMHGQLAAPVSTRQAGPTLPPPARLDRDALDRLRPTPVSELTREARTLRVCPPAAADSGCRYASLQEALAAALPGDHVILAPGVYEEGALIATPNLVLRGEPGAHLRGHAVQGKAALVVKADDVLIEGIECSGIAVRDGNGACIRNEGRDLTVRNVHFHDNQQGILGGSPSSGTLRIEGSLFERNGFGGRAHGVYVNREIETVVFRRNRILATTGSGHGFKSRARRNIIENNVIASLDGQDSRAIDLPNGGEVVIRGNVLEKGPNSESRQMIGLALEGKLHDVNETMIENNLFLFDTVPDGLIQDVARAVGLLPAQGTVIASKSPGEVILRDNVIVAAREIGPDVIERGNRTFSGRSEADLPAYPALPEPSE